MTWLVWAVLIIVSFLMIRYAPTGYWIDMAKPWDPRKGHPDGGEPDDRLEVTNVAIKTVKDLITFLGNFNEEAEISINGDYGNGATIWIQGNPVLDEQDFIDC